MPPEFLPIEGLSHLILSEKKEFSRLHEFSTVRNCPGVQPVEIHSGCQVGSVDLCFMPSRWEERIHKNSNFSAEDIIDREGNATGVWHLESDGR